MTPSVMSMWILPLLRPKSLAIACLVMLCGCVGVYHHLGGASSRPPSDLPDRLSPSARELVRQVYAGTSPERLVDYHLHLLGMGENGSGCYVNPRMLTWAHPWPHFQFEIYRSAARIPDITRAESQFSLRLSELAKTAPGRFLLLAFDENRGPDGLMVAKKTEFHIPNEYARKVANATPERFVAAGSVHPLRPDACEELRRLHAQGVRVIKWLPNAMGINPADPSCDPFYDTMHELGMILLTHGGVEAAVDAAEDQALGNPQRLQRALEHRVKVIIAHCASLGTGKDLANPEAPPVENWKLFLRMMDDPRWHGLLYADLSATTQMNRSAEFLRTILSREDLHARLVNGSDYPLPAVNVVIWLRPWVRAGLLDPADIAPLREIYDTNPLVFDFALKRRLRVIQSNGHISKFAASIFQENPALCISGRSEH